MQEREREREERERERGEREIFSGSVKRNSYFCTFRSYNIVNIIEPRTFFNVTFLILKKII
jgi:hypothetical protein